ncbi:MAG: hypothetical protein QM725_10800 [Lacibacter sp.]
MRLFYTCCFVLLTFTSCEVYQSGQYFNSENNSLSKIPLRPHKNEVDVFFNNEKPAKPFYRVKLVEVKGSHELSSEQMLKRLCAQAQREGVDAIILGDVSRQANTSFSSGETGIAYQKLVGIGLKYKERIDYMNEMLKEQEINYWPDTIPEPKIFQMKYDMNGKNISLKDTFLQRFFYNEIYLFEDENSIYSPPDDWGFMIDTLTHVFSKRYMVADIEQAKAIFQQNGYETKKPVIKIREGKKDILTTYELDRTYSFSGSLMSQRLHKLRPSVDVWEEEISYNRDGLPDKIKRYRIERGRRVLYFEIQSKYYTTADLPPTDN